MRCGQSYKKSRKPGIRFPFSLHHPHRDQVGGSGNVDRHPRREHHPVPCLHEAGLRSMCPPADGMPDSAFDHGCCRAGDGAGMMRERHGGGLRAGGSGRDAPAAARSIILTDERVACWCEGWKRAHLSEESSSASVFVDFCLASISSRAHAAVLHTSS